MQVLESLLPERQEFVMPEGEMAEEVNLIEYDVSAQRSADPQRREAYHEDGGSDEEEGGGHQGRNVQCAHQ